MKRKFYTDISSLVQKSTMSGPLDPIIDNLHDVLAVSMRLLDSAYRNGAAILSGTLLSNEVSKLLPGKLAARRLGPVQQRQVAQIPRRIFRELVIFARLVVRRRQSNAPD